jgi:DNA-directed RNA polymerase alpha subunit
MNIDELNLSVRSRNLLHRKEINDIDVLLSMTDDDIIGLYDGKVAMEEICEAVKPLRKANEVDGN